MDIAPTGRFIMTCSEGNDLVLWDVKGRVIQQLDTLCIETYKARISPCGRFVAVSGKYSDSRSMPYSVFINLHLLSIFTLFTKERLRNPYIFFF